MFEKALCDAEVIEVEEERSTEEGLAEEGAAEQGDARHSSLGMGVEGFDECPGPVREVTDPERSADFGRHQAEGSHNCCKHRNAIEYINSQYVKNRDRARNKGNNEKKRTGAFHRTRRTISAALKKKVILRDEGRCQTPGCGRRSFVEVHHIDPAGAGGKHTLSNCLTLCRVCHALVHEGKLIVEGEAPNALTWRDGSGKLLTGNMRHL